MLLGCHSGKEGFGKTTRKPKQPKHFSNQVKTKSAHEKDSFSRNKSGSGRNVAADAFGKKVKGQSKKAAETDRYNESAGYGSANKKGKRAAFGQRKAFGKNRKKKGKNKSPKTPENDSFVMSRKAKKESQKQRAPQMDLFQGKVLPSSMRKGDKRSVRKADKNERKMKKKQKK